MEYKDEERGTIINRERAKQLINFKNIRLDRKITPTDIDGLIEYDNKAYILMEFKYRGNEVPFGQRLAMVRMIDDFTARGKWSMLLICEHDVVDPEQDIDASKATVRRIYYKGEWRKPKVGFTNVKACIDQFIKHVKSKE